MSISTSISRGIVAVIQNPNFPRRNIPTFQPSNIPNGAKPSVCLRMMVVEEGRVPTNQPASTMATGRVQPALAPLILMGKQQTVKP